MNGHRKSWSSDRCVSVILEGSFCCTLVELWVVLVHICLGNLRPMLGGTGRFDGVLESVCTA